MRSKNRVSLAGLLAAAALAASNFGCGGGEQTAATLPAPILVSVSPPSATGQAGMTHQFTATVVNDSANKGVTWSVSCPATPCGSVSPASTASGAATTYTAPSAPPAVNLPVTITATSVSDTTKSAAAGVIILAVQVSTSVSSTAVKPGATAQLTAVVTNDPTNSGVDWSISCSPAASACGTISPATTASGVATTYNAPPPPAVGVTVTFTATSVANTAVSSSGTITVLGVTVSVTATTALVEAGATAQLTATVTNDATNAGVNWTVSCGATSCGSVSPASTPSGTPTTYTAPSTPPPSDLTVTVTATSVACTPASAAATMTVPAITVSIVPNSALLPVNITQWFAATVGYDPSNKGVTWAVTQGGTECSSGCGTIAPSATASGISTTYTAPAKVPANSAVTIAATSVTDTTKTANAAITLTVGTVKLVPDSLGFGHVVVKHSSSPQTATLTNTGRAALGITGITITGSTPGDFSQTNTCGTQVGAGMSCTITVTFTPQEWHARGATMYISDTSVDSPQQIILSGVGITGDAADTSAVRSALAGSGMATVPSPTGPSNVGTRVMNLVDGARDDPFLANGAKRELLVRFWYPAPSSQDCEPAEYTSPAVWSYFSQLLGVPLPEVKTNSCLDAPITEGRHPVVVFTHGYTGTFTDYTFIFEDLASRGYVVASVDHTYEATAVEFLDGRFVKSVLGSHWDDTWQPDEQTLSFAVSVRLGDLRFVIGELERLNAAADSPFSGRLDVSRIAIAGHSLGGMTALNGALQDARFRAAVLIDGWPDTLTTATETPVLILAAGHERWSDGERGLWNDLRGPRLAVNLRGAEHLTPSDLVWLAKGATKTGTMGTEKTIAAVRDYVAAFLDANLLGKPMDSLLSGPSSEYPEAEVTTQNESLRGKP